MVYPYIVSSIQTVSALYYEMIISTVCKYMAQKRHEMKNVFFLHHDNKRLHTVHSFQEYAAKFKIDIFTHPPYSQDLAPCSFWLFPQQKTALRGKHFSTYQEVVTASQKFLNSLPRMTLQKHSVSDKIV